ncbi:MULTISPECIES: hypothetical protein [Streptomyces]|uniref:hypothetical protein n=1 Tax=Streptomyces TaxID=1883 RepID=UPI00287FC12C|nr:hypothetical protein [Streptomyces sp. CGMCC 4.1456]WNF64424.1 hypothetical protein RJD14_18395 [Streptomyces sp. CGMCC 4.1456]
MTSEPARDGHLDPGADTISDHPDLDAIEELCSGSTPDSVLAARARETVPQLVAEVRRLRWLVEYGACPTAGTTGTEFVLALDEEMLAYFREMVDVLVERVGVPRAEAVARVNATYGTREWVALDLQLMGHELPEYWAYGLYYGQDGRGRTPVGDPVVDADIDFTTLPVRPAPPKDSPFWTVEELKVLSEPAEGPGAAEAGP